MCISLMDTMENEIDTALWVSDTFEVDGVTIYRYVMPSILSNAFALFGKEGALIIDPHPDEQLFSELTRRKLRNTTILLTHEHIDHICGVNRLKEMYEKTKVVCSEKCHEMLSNPGKNLAKFWDVILMDRDDQAKNVADSLIDRNYICNADTTFQDRTEWEFEGNRIKMVSAPGHSPGGSLIFLNDRILFSGDNLVEGNGVICRFPGGSRKEYLQDTLPQIRELSDNYYIFPGHGRPGRLKDFRKYVFIY